MTEKERKRKRLRDREREKEREREIEREREREGERERAKPGQAVYFTFNRGVFRTLSNEVISLEVTIFTKISILDV